MIHRLDDHTDFRYWGAHMGQGDLAFDVGANIGQSTKDIAQAYKKVVAFEPCLESFEILQAEMPENVHCSFSAVSDRDGFVTLTETERSITTGQLTTGEGLHWGEIIGERQVPAVTLNVLAEKWGYPDFIKIDTEGHEVQVVEGGEKVFARGPRVVIEVHKAENEAPIRYLLSHYLFRKKEHLHLRERSPIRRNHFYLLGEAK